MDAWSRLQQELESNLDEMVVEVLWDKTRQGLDLPSWNEAPTESRKQFRAVYQHVIAAMQRAYEEGYMKALEELLKKQMGGK